MAANRPIWLLDIDGVINASPGQHHVWPESQWVRKQVWGGTREWRIVAAQPVIDFIHIVSVFADLMWLTTWQEEAHNVAQALGLPEHIPVLTNPMVQHTRVAGPHWWKLDEAVKVAALGRPIVWTDDDLSTEIQMMFRGDVKVPSCLIAPKSSEGLTMGHKAQIAEFLNAQ